MKNEIKFKAMIDRIEGNLAVVLLGEEEQESIEFPLKFLPQGVCEGEILTFKIKSQKDKTKEAKEKVSDMIRKLKAG